MENKILNYIYTTKNIESIKSFGDVKGEIGQSSKEVYFIRAIGVNSTYVEEIKALDNGSIKPDIVYNRILELSGILDKNNIAFYSECYDKWLQSNKAVIETKLVKPDMYLAQALASACVKALNIFKKYKTSINATIEKNFIVKTLFWFDNVFDGILESWKENVRAKIVAENIAKEQEYLFFYMLTCMGVDVLLLQYEKDIDVSFELKKLSKELVLGEMQRVSIIKYLPQMPVQEGNQEKIASPVFSKSNEEKSERLVVHLPERNRTSSMRTEIRTEKSFEELAQLASSIVMIAVHDEKGEVVGTGSGIMIGRKGYILTNHHVTCHGRSYSVRIEGDKNVYKTDELIKYHSLFDLSVIRIDKEINPLHIYNGEQKLVRGQKVVAIGSPLGLFNSVSDGIISGFRKVNDVDMIQFTAPISNGSSGGAVLNMYGEIVGIVTLGIDEGQNINLAVTYDYLADFVRGFQN